MTNDNEKNVPEQNQPEQNPATQEPARFTFLRNVIIGVKPGYVLRKVGQAYMVMPTGPRMKDYQGMITLNETGAFLYKESEKEEPTQRKLIDACIKEYGASEEEALAAVNSFINQCADCGLFECSQVVADNQERKILSMEEYAKLQAEMMKEQMPEEEEK